MHDQLVHAQLVSSSVHLVSHTAEMQLEDIDMPSL